MFADSRPFDHWVPPWELAHAVDRLTRTGQIADVIHVAIDNSPGRGRLYEYMPPSGRFDEETDRFNEGGRPGEADVYMELLREFIHPYMTRHYRVMDDPQYTGMAGSSLGGLVTMHAGWEHPDFARRLGVFSGTFWAAEDFVREIESPGPDQRRPLLIYLDSGTVGPTHDNIDGVLRVRDALIRHGWLLNFDLKHVVGIGHRHNEAAWRQRLDDCLRFLYPAGDCFHAERSEHYRQRVAKTPWRLGDQAPAGKKHQQTGDQSEEPLEMKRGGHVW
jgi:predicted alpha/beta superfamily hydrolase